MGRYDWGVSHYLPLVSTFVIIIALFWELSRKFINIFYKNNIHINCIYTFGKEYGSLYFPSVKWLKLLEKENERLKLVANLSYDNLILKDAAMGEKEVSHKNDDKIYRSDHRVKLSS